MTWPVAFLLTQLIEVPIVSVGSRGCGISPTQRVGIALGASGITHPVLWFVLHPLLGPSLPYAAFFGVAEAWVVLTEAAWLRWWRMPRPLLLALTANVTSAAIGLLIHWWR